VQIARTATCVCSVLVSVCVGGAPREENPSIWHGRGKFHGGGDELVMDREASGDFTTTGKPRKESHVYRLYRAFLFSQII